MPHISDLPGKVVRQILIHLCKSSGKEFDASFNYLFAANPGCLPTANGIKVEHEDYEGGIEFKLDGEIPHWSGRKKVVKDNFVDRKPAKSPVHSDAVSKQSFLVRGSAGVPIELHNEHRSLHLRKAHFPWFIAHQDCNRNERSVDICFQCACQAKCLPDESDPKLSASG